MHAIIFIYNVKLLDFLKQNLHPYDVGTVVLYIIWINTSYSEY
jgi:hypothetical protein